MTTLSRRSALVAALGAVTAAATAACSDDTKPSNAASQSSGGSTGKINYLTSLGAFGRESYAYVAQKKGFFKDAGLDVSITPGNGSGENLKLLAGGQADIVVVDFAALAIAVGEGAVTGLTAFAAVLQRSVAGLMTLEGYGITTPKDLEGKKVGDPSGSISTTLFPIYAKLAGIDASKVTFVTMQARALPSALASRDVDVIGQFVVGRPTIEATAGGKPVVVLPYSEYLTDLYGDTVLASDKLAKEKPDLVKRFRDALLQGLRYAVDNPDEAGQILAEAVPTAKAPVTAAELKIMASYVRASGTTVGALEEDRVARALAILAGSGTIPQGVKPEQIVSFDLTPKA
jgi:NitT/TauT family transport system substrate-binding protein